MRASSGIALALVLVYLSLPGCAALQAREQAQKFVRDNRLRTQAWYTARAQLVTMCTAPMLRADCAPRYVKKTNSPYNVDDWEWGRLPSYQTIVAAHEKALRVFTPDPPLYIESLLAAARYFALKTDAGEMSPEG